ncbi:MULTISPECIES: uracil-DNA glycosylase [unclassified Campylobacter]|uniref:uracil-DNA glycosylase n=1 Tax=unclassified Campylobacter TaxID=2593542 RepID=UPI0022E9E147|nr:MULTISPECIES: uracil-DNA glycosylase [unclassified Campylobacter]MDA3044732.1 uracil-DNA glycosylase [Campylobacter sp. JMF_07 ED4]MDA3063146.1 uracil-DNA glycosylase [Campylobacter sp. JMF_11 EL3]MDA3071709.1 uracil-DNA glycosylase [Campylobacter sp. VBCF_03 NA9]MDA3074227.1 uracil-DNA glycosylase [Campylobacter sp. JMF_05 ED3]
MQGSKLHRLLCYKAFGYRYIDAGILASGERFFSDIDSLSHSVQNCALCELSKTRTHAMVPYGDKNAKIMVISQCPTHAEDESGEPFNGNLGEKFRASLKELCGLEIGEIYASYLIKCALNLNKKLTSEIILKCAPYAIDEIKIIRPKVVLCLGELCAKILLKNNNLPDIRLIHGTPFREGGITFIPTFDLNFLSQNPSQIPLFHDDLRKIKEFL